MAYIDRHRNSGFKIGDKVIIIRVSHTGENGWVDAWVNSMNKYVGQKGEIIVNSGSHGFKIDFGDGNEKNYNFPYFILRHVNTPNGVDPFSSLKHIFE